MRAKNVLIRIVAVTFMLYAAVSYMAVRRELAQLQDMERSLKGELCALQEETAALEAAAEQGQDDETMERLARERLGLVLPGEKIFYFVSEREE